MNQLITHLLRIHYRIEVTGLEQLRLGADINASIYKVHASDQKTYFVKLKRGVTHLAIVDLLQRAGLEQLITPIAQLTHQADDITLIVYPFIDGKDGFCRSLTNAQQSSEIVSE